VDLRTTARRETGRCRAQHGRARCIRAHQAASGSACSDRRGGLGHHSCAVGDRCGEAAHGNPAHLWLPGRQKAWVGGFFLPTDDDELKAEILEGMSSLPPYVMSSSLDHHILSWDGAAVVAACKLPALLIAAATPLADLKRMRQLCPQLVVGQTVGAGHFNNRVVPEQVNAMIERFLATSVEAPTLPHRETLAPQPYLQQSLHLSKTAEIAAEPPITHLMEKEHAHGTCTCCGTTTTETIARRRSERSKITSRINNEVLSNYAKRQLDNPPELKQK
jgi:hypothetical protein